MDSRSVSRFRRIRKFGAGCFTAARTSRCRPIPESSSKILSKVVRLALFALLAALCSICSKPSADFGYVPVRGPVQWQEVSGCCGKLHATVEYNVVCFDLDFRYRQKLQTFCKLSNFDHAYSWYLQMAQSLFEDVGRLSDLHQKIAWRIEDNSTINADNIRYLNDMGIIAVAHSIERSDNVSLYTTLLPNFHFIETRGFARLISEFSKLETPLQNRSSNVFWAGSTTGVPCVAKRPCASVCDTIQRVKLVREGQQIPWTNFSITKAVQWCTAGDVALNDLTSQFVRELEWGKHMGVIDIDGNVDAWGLPWRLASGSAVFRVESSYLHYFSELLVEEVHYVSVAGDLSDLAEKTAQVTMISHVDHLANISKNAKRVIEQHSYERVIQAVAEKLA